MDGEWFGAPFTFNEPYAFIRGIEPGKHTITGMEGDGSSQDTWGQKLSTNATFDIPFVIAEGRATILRVRLIVQDNHDKSGKFWKSITLPELSEDELAAIRRDLWSYRNIQQWMAEPR